MASGDTLLIFDAGCGLPVVAAPCEKGTRNEHRTLLYDDSTDESADFELLMPQHYAGGGVEVILTTAGVTATTGSARIQTQFEKIAGQDMDADSFASANSGAAAANGTSGIETITTITHTDGGQMDSVAAGDRFRLRVTRDADGTSGTDDMSGDMELTTVELREV